MLKKDIIILCTTAAVLFVYACSMPDPLPKKIQITGSPEFDLPVITGAIDLNRVIDENFRQDFPAGLELYDVVNYTYQGEKIQAFLMRYEMYKTSLNPDTFLSQYDDAIGKFDNLTIPIDPIDETFTVPDFTPGGGAGTGHPVQVPLGELFSRAKTAANVSTTVGPLGLVTVGSGSQISAIPSFNANIPLSGFDTLTFASGELVMTVTLSGPGGTPLSPDVDITISGSQLTGLAPSSAAGNSISLDASTPSDEIVFNLAGKTLAAVAPLDFVLGTITDYSTAPLVNFDMTINIGWDPVYSIQINAATGLKIGTIDVTLPNDTPDIDFGTMPPEFLHAQIGTGELTVSIPDMPVTPGTGTTWFGNFKLKYDISLRQNPYTFANEIDGNPVTDTFPGLSGFPSVDWRLQFEDSNPPVPVSLNGRHINPNPIGVVKNGTSKIIIEADPAGIDFELSSADIVAGYFEIHVNQDVDITDIAEVHWDITNTITVPQIPAANKPNLKDAASYVKWIEFAGHTPDVVTDGFGVNFVFDAIIDGHGPGLEMTLRCNEFVPPLEARKTLAAGDNIFKNSQSTRLNIQPDAGGDVFLNFDISLQAVKEPGSPYGGGKALKITNVALGDTLTVKTPGTAGTPSPDIVIPFFKWTKALVSFGSQADQEDRYPKETDDPPALDLNDMMGKYTQGFSITGAQAALYVSGPDIINTVNPNLEFAAKYNYDTAASAYLVDLPFFSGTITASPATVDLHPVGGQYIYTGVQLPAGGLAIESAKINQIMTDLPQDMILAYKMTTNELEVTPQMIDGIDRTQSDFVLELLMLVPVHFTAGPQGASFSFSDLFTEEKDLFGREKPDEFNQYLAAENLYINVGFNSSIFSSAKLKIDKYNRVFPNGIRLGGNSINIKIGGSDLDALKKNLLIPDIRMEFPPNASIKIPRNIGLAKISFGGSGLHYEFDMPEQSMSAGNR
ncbi:MAG: hypothetical protein LBD48_11195 [Treponema sp.]|jgi:hypothetical protein|nr:hypothetical protein [Treponema sp.]